MRNWKDLATQSSSGDSGNSFCLAFIVALHVATAVTRLIFFPAESIRIVGGFLTSLPLGLAAQRLILGNTDAQLAWLLIIAAIPVGITGLLLEHTFRTVFANPLTAAAQ